MLSRGKRTEKVLPIIFKQMIEDYWNMYEVAYLFDSNGKLWEKWIGTKQQVDATSFLQYIQMIKKIPNEFLISAHTHTNNSCFSLMDWSLVAEAKDRYMYMILMCQDLFYVVSPRKSGYKELSDFSDKWLKTFDFLSDEPDIQSVDWDSIKSCGRNAFNDFISYALNARTIIDINGRLEAFAINEEGNRILKIFERERLKLIL